LARQRDAYHTRPKLSGYILLILGRQRQHDTLGAHRPWRKQQEAERYCYKLSHQIISYISFL
jgi:hypothetical protein